MLFIACVSVTDYEIERPDDPPPSKEDIKWNVGAIAERLFFKNLFKKVDTNLGLDKLDSELRVILENESEIEFIDEP